MTPTYSVVTLNHDWTEGAKMEFDFSDGPQVPEKHVLSIGSLDADLGIAAALSYEDRVREIGPAPYELATLIFQITHEGVTHLVGVTEMSNMLMVKRMSLKELDVPVS